MPDVSVVHVDLGGRGYDVVVGRSVATRLPGVLEACPGASKAVIVTDSNVPEAWAEAGASAAEAAGLDPLTLRVAGGEECKTMATVAGLLEEMAESGIHRQDPLVAVGGGVVGDISGFVAASYMRGIPLVQVPTTLLAMVDSAIGGKTGVNLPAGKNLAGAFYQPIAVLADTAALDTLPERELRCGLAEIAKYGFIGDPGVLTMLERGVPSGDDLAMLIDASVRCKAAVVEKDELESGVRAILNFGHTLGHAIETASAHRLNHGEAVSVGMVFALSLGKELGLVDYLERGRALLEGIGLPVRVDGIEAAEVAQVMDRDKKFNRGRRYVVLEDLGSPSVVSDVAETVLNRALAEVGIS